MNPRSANRALLSLLALACIAALPACTGDRQARADADVGQRLKLKPCSLPSPLTGKSIEAQCGTFEVPENREKPDGRKIALNIAWIGPDEPGDTLPDPIVFLAGGPGQSAVDTFPMLAPVLSDANKNRGFLLVDQRGTGKSNLLSCKLDEDSAEPATAAEAMAQMQAITRRCIDDLSAKADLTQYTTTNAVADLEDIRKAIGAPAYNLIGISYGTRVAQQYALRHPTTTRTVTLDSPVPNAIGLGNIFARNLEDALDAQFALCKESPACAKKMGDPRAELQSLLDRLRAQPAQVTYRDASTGEEQTGTLTASTVAGLVRMYAYMPAAGALLPQLIHEANNGRYSGLMALAGMLKGEMKDSMAMGMQFSVVCSEDADSMVARDEDKGTVLGNEITGGMAEACKQWPRGHKPADFNQPLKGDLPVLVLAGEFDPVTPPRYGEEIVKTLPQSRLLVLKGQGHSVLPSGCMPKLFAQFVERADAKGLDAKCLDSLGPAPPFTSFNGWEP